MNIKAVKKIVGWVIGILLFFSWANVVWGQTYTVGDSISTNFGNFICANNDSDTYWSYDEDGRGKVVWINLFTSW